MLRGKEQKKMRGLEKMYWDIYVVGFVLTGFFLFLSLILFIKLHIPKVIGILTGMTRRAAVKNRLIKKQHPALVTSYHNSPYKDNIETKSSNIDTKGETRLLYEFDSKQQTAKIDNVELDGDFIIEKSITMIHTQEVII